MKYSNCSGGLFNVRLLKNSHHK